MKIRWIFTGILVSFAVTFLLVFIIAAASYSTDMSENAAGVCAYAAAAAGVFSGAYTASVKSGGKIIISAMSVSFVYTAVMIVASIAVNGKINTDVHCVSICAGVIFAGFLAALAGSRKTA